ncbi:MAG: hypothetical protein IJE22_00930 [Oscillibacter sp.]|nr:hypothetical protein [Oscillibacter sp.]
MRNFVTPHAEEESVSIRMEITFDLPAEMAEKVELLGFYEFEKCSYDQQARQMTVSAVTTLYRKGA